MIVDHRTDALQRHRSTLVGFCASAVGNVIEIVHIWPLEDLVDATLRRRDASSICRSAEKI
jgi:hypothetical protein